MKRILLLICLYLILWIILKETVVYNQTDSLWSVYTTVSLVREGNLDIDEYYDLFPKAFYANLTKYKAHTYNYYPYGVSILALPHIWIINQWYKWKDKDLQEKVISSSTINLEKSISSSLLSIATCFFFVLAFHITNSISKSLFLVFLFSFCTLIFSVLSRGLWQHTGSILLLSIALYCILQKRQTLLILSALPLFFTYIIRPTNILPVFFLGLIVIYQLKSKSVYFLGLGLSILIIFFSVNFSNFGSITHPYYDFRKVNGSETFYEALLGNLFSPARGLFIYSPIFLFSLYGIYLKKKNEALLPLDYALFFIIIFHWLLVSRNLNWWGGHCYGYRLLSDLIPFFMYYLIFFIKYNKIKSYVFAIFIITVLVSFYINFKGAQYMETYLWNLSPDNIDTNPSRNWNWKDTPFMR